MMRGKSRSGSGAGQRAHLRMQRTLHLAAAVLFAAAGGCTDPLDRPVALRLSIDADSIVRAATVRVEVVLEAQLSSATGNKGEVWETVLQRTLKPNPQGNEDWPWE